MVVEKPHPVMIPNVDYVCGQLINTEPSVSLNVMGFPRGHRVAGPPNDRRRHAMVTMYSSSGPAGGFVHFANTDQSTGTIPFLPDDLPAEWDYLVLYNAKTDHGQSGSPMFLATPRENPNNTKVRGPVSCMMPPWLYEGSRVIAAVEVLGDSTHGYCWGTPMNPRTHAFVSYVCEMAGAQAPPLVRLTTGMWLCFIRLYISAVSAGWWENLVLHLQ